MAAGNPLGMPAGPYVLDRSDGAFNPSLTFALQPLDWLQPYLRWSRTFRPPTVQEALMGGEHPAEGGPPQMFFPNPFLEPDTSKGWELGVNLGSDRLFGESDRVRAKVTVFRNEVDDYVTAMFGAGKVSTLPAGSLAAGTVNRPLSNTTENSLGLPVGRST